MAREWPESENSNPAIHRAFEDIREILNRSDGRAGKSNGDKQWELTDAVNDLLYWWFVGSERYDNEKWYEGFERRMNALHKAWGFKYNHPAFTPRREREE